ncbi:transposase [Chloroflexota bacterium]
MKTRRYSQGQIFRILQEVDFGTMVVDAARKHGVSSAIRIFIFVGICSIFLPLMCIISDRN